MYLVLTGIIASLSSAPIKRVYGTPTDETVTIALDRGWQVRAIEYEGSNIWVGIATIPEDTPCKILKVDFDEMNYTVYDMDAWEETVRGLVYDGSFLWAAISTDPSIITKINVTTGERTLNITLHEGLNNVRAMAHDDTWIWAATASTPASLIRINKTDGTYSIYDYPETIHGLVYDGEFLWGGTWSNPAEIYKINVSDASRYTAYNLTSGEKNCRAITYFKGFVWAGLATSPGKYLKMNPENGSYEIWTLDTGEDMTYALTDDGTYIWAGIFVGYDSPSYLVRINATDGAHISYRLESPLNGLHTLFYKKDYLWFGTEDGYGGPANLTKKRLPIGPVPPSAPQNLVASSVSDGISLSWSPPTSDGGSPITSYKIYRGTISGTETYFTSVTDTSYTDTSVSAGTTYYYKVSAVNIAGEGPPSNEANATFGPPKITFYMDPPSGTVTADGVTKNNGDTGTYASGVRVHVVAKAPRRYSFYEWQTTGYVAVDSISDYDTYMTASGTGTLKAIFVHISKFSIRPNPFSPNGDGVKDATKIKVMFTTTVDWLLQIKDGTGAVVRSWTGTGASLTQVWDGKDEDGNYVPDGKYKCTVSAGSVKKTKKVTVDTTPPTITGVTDSPDSFNPKAGEKTTISYTLSEQCKVKIKIYNSSGKLIRTLSKTQSMGPNSMVWDGKDKNGNIVPDGTYTYKIYVTDKAGNKATTYPMIGTVSVTS